MSSPGDTELNPRGEAEPSHAACKVHLLAPPSSLIRVLPHLGNRPTVYITIRDPSSNYSAATINMPQPVCRWQLHEITRRR